MKTTFADTSFYVALANESDANHAIAVEHAESIFGQVLTTEYVLVELGNWLSRTGDRGSFIALMEQINSDPDITVIWATRSLFERGFTFYRQRPDKDWSLTDCISFVLMEEHDIVDALTADHHFEQAGFTVLLR